MRDFYGCGSWTVSSGDTGLKDDRHMARPPKNAMPWTQK